MLFLDISLTSLQVEINVWNAKPAAANNAYMFDHGKTVQGWSAVAGEPMGMKLPYIVFLPSLV